MPRRRRTQRPKQRVRSRENMLKQMTNRPQSLQPQKSSKGVIIIQIKAVDKKAKAKKQSAVDSMRVISKRLIRSKSAQDAVARLPHIAHILNITRQPLTLSYSLIEGEYAPSPPPSPQAEKVVVVKKIRKLNLRVWR